MVNAFAGQQIVQSDFEISAAGETGLVLSNLGIGNHITLDDEQLLANVH